MTGDESWLAQWMHRRGRRCRPRDYSAGPPSSFGRALSIAASTWIRGEHSHYQFQRLLDRDQVHDSEFSNICIVARLADTLPQPKLHFRMKSLLADITPLRRHQPFRRLWVGLLISSIGGQLTIVGVAYQAYVLTHSTLVVGLVSLVQLAPTLVGALGGGAVADAIDRRRILILAQVMLAAASGGLALNAFMPHPELWVLFVATSASAAFQGLDWPTRLALMPMILPTEDLSSAYALQSLVSSVSVVVGPSLAGLVIARFGLGTVYTVDVVSYGASLTAAMLLPKFPPTAGGTPISLRSVMDGLRFLRSEQLLMATFGIDLVAMTFGMPKAVFPALGIRLFHGGAGTVGLLFAAPGAGALLGSLLSGWTGRVRAQARALVFCMLGWAGRSLCSGWSTSYGSASRCWASPGHRMSSERYFAFRFCNGGPLITSKADFPARSLPLQSRATGWATGNLVLRPLLWDHNSPCGQGAWPA